MNKYYCNKCNHYHYKGSKAFRKHLSSANLSSTKRKTLREELLSQKRTIKQRPFYGLRIYVYKDELHTFTRKQLLYILRNRKDLFHQYNKYSKKSNLITYIKRAMGTRTKIPLLFHKYIKKDPAFSLTYATFLKRINYYYKWTKSNLMTSALTYNKEGGFDTLLGKSFSRKDFKKRFNTKYDLITLFALEESISIKKEKPNLMIKNLREATMKSFQELSKQNHEYSIALDFEHYLKTPERHVTIRGGKTATLRIADFEMFGHTHPNQKHPFPSVADLRNMELKHPEFLIAGGSGKTIILNIENIRLYEAWKSKTISLKPNSDPLPKTNYKRKLKENRFKILRKRNKYSILWRKEGRQLFYELTGVRVYKYHKDIRIKMKEDLKVEKRMPTFPSYLLKSFQEKPNEE